MLRRRHLMQKSFVLLNHKIIDPLTVFLSLKSPKLSKFYVIIANFRQFCLWLLENIRFHIHAKKLNRASRKSLPAAWFTKSPLFEIELTDLSYFLSFKRVLS